MKYYKKYAGYRNMAGKKIFIIAEAGINHNGSVKTAKKLVDAAVEAGADAVKFQAFKADAIVTRYAKKAEYQRNLTDRDETQLKMLKKLELTEGELKNIAAYSKNKGIIFLSSSFDKESVDLLDDIGVPAFKIPSGEITNTPLLEYIAGKGKPIIVSTGMSDMNEIREAVEVIRKKDIRDITLLHCVTSYPTGIEDVNLRAMQTMRRSFKLPVGFSDHTAGFTASIAAAALGASIIEKHFTLDRNMSGPDHNASLEPGELKEMILAIRSVEKALGDGRKIPTKEERVMRDIARKKIVADTDICKGETIKNSMISVKRIDGKGLSPKYIDFVIGKKAKRDIRKDGAITRGMLRGYLR